MPTLARILSLLLFFAFAAHVAVAHTFPSRPLLLVVPFPAGGTSDILARLLAQKLGESLGQAIVVENRAGAGGTIGSDAVAKSKPDGYTLVLASVGTHAINPSVYPSLPYDPVKDFTPISLIANVPTAVVVNPSLPVHSMRELIAYARKNPGKVTFASAGIGTTQHLAGEMLNNMAHINMLHVPYKGGAPAVTALLGGEVQVMFPNIPLVHAYIAAGKLRVLAVASTHRSPIMPDVPTVAESSGLRNFDVATWFGILASRGTSRDVVERLHDAVAKVEADRDVRAKLMAQGAEPLTDSPDQFNAYIQSELVKWSKLVKALPAGT